MYRVGFTYGLDRLKSKASKCKGPLVNVYNIVGAVIGLYYFCCRSALYSLNNPSVFFFAQLHSILEYYRILNTRHHPRLYSKWLNTLQSVYSHESGDWEGLSEKG